MAKSLTAVGVAAVIAVGGTVAVTSANADNSSAAASSAGQPMGGEGFGTVGGTGADGVGSAMGSGGFGGGSAGRSLIAGALHGEFVVSSGTGTVTERLQTGSITALTSTSVTVKSTDAYTATYVVPSGVDVSSLANGSTVTVIATVAGSTLTVVSISSVSVTAGGRGMSSGGGTGGFTPPDGSAPGGAGSGAVGGIGGSGSGHSGSTGAGSGSAGTATDTGI